MATKALQARHVAIVLLPELAKRRVELRVGGLRRPLERHQRIARRIVRAVQLNILGAQRRERGIVLALEACHPLLQRAVGRGPTRRKE